MTKSKIKNFFVCLFIFSLPFTLYPLLSKQVNAQSVKLGIYPPILQIMIQPGKSITQVYKIDNQSDPAIITSSVVPFSPLDNIGNISLVDCANLAVLGCESLPWISFQNADLRLGQSFFLGSDRQQEVVLKISVPEYAAEGDYYNTILFSTQAPPGSVDSKSRATVTIGSNILITVSKDGNPDRKIVIDKFESLHLYDSFDQIPVDISVKNIGQAYTNVKGSVTLSGFPGLQSSFTIPPTNILAGTSRTLFSTPSASVDNSLTLSKGFYIGKYKLNLFLTSEYGKEAEEQIYFFALPYKIILVIFVTFIIFIFMKKLLKGKK
ncbi:hypothetical protein HYT02_06120 [Candidatus Gottesmanbacteria bacterium]|nr:hypothetical protein [Candidatus Gottesmanbacteria bacterium]